MALMLAKTYAAFKAAGVDEDQAQAAAEELASFEGRFNSLESGIFHIDGKATAIEATVSVIEGKVSGIEGRITTLETRVTGLENRVGALEARVAAVEAKISVLLWAVGINVATTIAILGVLLHRG